MPAHTTVQELARVPGMAIGLMSAGIGNVSATQTYVDIGQGARVPSSLYDAPLPRIHATRSRSGGVRVPPVIWKPVRSRAGGVPADLVPGALGSALRAAGVSVGARVGGPAVAMVVDRGGRVPARLRCPGGACAQVEVVRADLERVRGLTAGLRGDDLVIAFARPPAPPNRALPIGLAGRGAAGTLTSDSTRMEGYVLSTDVAPTVLARLGVVVPSAMSGEPIRAEGEADPASVDRLGDRLAAIGPRRGPVAGVSLLIWASACAACGIAFGRRGLRVGLSLLALAVVYLPAVLLVTAALEPSELAERLVVGAGAPGLALLTLRVLSPFGALAVAGAVSVSGYAVDVIAGSHLTELSLIGPNPAAGIRFYGIGNELEATVAALVPIATGAGLCAWAPRASPRAAAAAFGVTGLVAAAAFAPGRFGADVGAAIGISLGAAAAASVCLGLGRRRSVLVLAAPLACLAGLIAADLLTGGDAHLTRSVLRAGGLDQLSEVAQRRLELSVRSFDRYAATALLWPAVAALVAGVMWRRRIERWFGAPRWGWAGLVGALAATLAGTLANDSGALLLILGTGVIGATVGLAWASEAPTRGPA